MGPDDRRDDRRLDDRLDERATSDDPGVYRDDVHEDALRREPQRRDTVTDDRPEVLHDDRPVRDDAVRDDASMRDDVAARDDAAVRQDAAAPDDAGRDARGTSAGGVDVEGRWKVTQSRFLESPREAVAAADELVSDVIEDVRRRLDAERAGVAESWRDEGTSTEDLRTAMLRYREALDRLTARRS